MINNMDLRLKGGRGRIFEQKGVMTNYKLFVKCPMKFYCKLQRYLFK